MFKLTNLFIFIFFIFSSINSYAKIEIKFKIEDEIITNIDIEQEKKYLIFFNPNLKKLNKSQITKISENSLIQEIIKKHELNKVFKDYEDKKFIKNLKKNLFKFKGAKNEKEFKQILSSQKISYERIIEKAKNERLWSQLIFRKFEKSVKINEEKLKAKLINKISNEKKYEYNLSEILFEIVEKENFKEKNIEIKNFIKSNGFAAAVSKYSISNSAYSDGKLGWIKETLLSENLVAILSSMSSGSITKPIKYPNGYLLLKLNDKKEIKQKIDLEKELKELINFEKNKQLNQFSLLFYKKLKQNTDINEY
mgnify:CR=1 FL=1